MDGVRTWQLDKYDRGFPKEQTGGEGGGYIKPVTHELHDTAQVDGQARSIYGYSVGRSSDKAKG